MRPSGRCISLCPYGLVHLHINYMTVTTAPTSNALATELISEMAGTSSSVDMMIGIGLNKESDAVFFQYLGEEQTPSALMLPSGKPLTRLANVRLVGLTVADNVGAFNSTKLNVYIESTSGRTVMLTSGLNTLWSQYLVSGLMALFNEFSLDQTFTLDTWKGTSQMRPAFAAIRQDGNKMSCQMLTDQLKEAKADRDNERTLKIMRDAVEIIHNSVTGGAVEPVSVSEPSTTVDESLDF
jgi:hypothetical protein